jgi:hypothetical protein
MANRYSRRSFLAASGATTASAALWALLGRRSIAHAAGEGTAPKRVVFWFVPEGMEAPFFWPAATGPLSIDMTTRLQPGESPNATRHRNWVLQPLKAFESQLALVRGITLDWAAADRDYHLGAMKSVLCGAGDSSMDELIGAELKGTATLPFVRLGVQGWFVGNGGYRELFYRNGQGIEVNWNVAAVYNSVFPGGVPTSGGGPTPEQLRQKRILSSRLDLIGSTRGALVQANCAAGRDGRARLENYLASLESIESQTQALLSTGSQPVPEVEVTVPPNATSTAFWRNDANLRDLGKLMMDVGVASLAFDRTRHLTLQWSATGVDRHDGYAFIPDIENPTFGDHALAHTDQGRPVDSIRRDRARVFRFYCEQLAYFLGKLAAVPEGTGTLLDSTAVVWVTESTTIDHSLLFPSEMDLPCLVAGSAGGSFVTGRYFDARNGNQRRINDEFLLTIARGLGSGIQRIGNGSTVFSPLLA